MKKLDDFLVRAKVCDPDNTLSLSNVMLMVIIVRLATTQALDWTTLSGMLLVLLNHNGRKYFARDRAHKAISDTDRLAKLERETQLLVQASNLKGMGR